MAWFKVDDSFREHPKVLAIPPARRYPAVGLWTMAGDWCAKYTTDGLIPHDVVMRDARGVRGACSWAADLVHVGLWHDHGHTCKKCAPVPEGYYLFHDWAEYQPSAAKVQADRAKTAAKVAAWRARKAALEGSNVTQLRPPAESTM